MRTQRAHEWLRRSATLPLAAVLALTLLACNFVQQPFANWRPTSSSSRSPAVSATPLPTRLALALTATPRPSRPSPASTLAATATLPPASHADSTEVSPTSLPMIEGVRPCGFVPGVSTPAVMPPEVLAAYTPTPYSSPTLPAGTAVDQATTDQQLKVYRQLWDTVNTEYVYRDFNGRDWKAIGAKYEALVKRGLAEADFYNAMDLMVAELGDNHSRYESPEAVRLADQAFQGHNDYTGVGILLDSVPQVGRGSIVYVFPGSPAAEAGLRSHDNIVAVNGESLFDENGQRKDIVRGPDGTLVTLTIERLGEKTFDVTMKRRRITSAQPIDYCLMPGTRLAYLFLPSLDDATLPGQVRTALEALTASGPLDGLVFDNRQNGGGAESVLTEMLGFFVSGTQGHFVSHEDERSLVIRGEGIGNSQTVPLVVLIGPNTASYGEVMSGILQNSGRARLVGQKTMGIVETLWGYDFDDGSRAWIAHETFQPSNLPNAVWKKRGIEPDFPAPTRWDLFTEATDPGLAVAVQLIRVGNR
jgi:carboxyl-terminal processing protease